MTPELFGHSVGAVLEQKQDRVVRFIAAAGRRLVGDKSMYSPTDRVICSVIFACRQWERLLHHKPFVVNHDVQTWLRVVQRPTKLGCKWLKELAAFRF